MWLSQEMVYSHISGFESKDYGVGSDTTVKIKQQKAQHYFDERFLNGAKCFGYSSSDVVDLHSTKFILSCF